MKISLGEFIYIIIFCTAYGIGANLESRLYPVPDSMATKARAYAMSEVNRIDREEAFASCEKEAIASKGSENAIVWYYNSDSDEYWCGLIVPSKLTRERAAELKNHITVLNSDKYILEVVANESNKYNRR